MQAQLRPRVGELAERKARTHCIALAALATALATPVRTILDIRAAGSVGAQAPGAGPSPDAVTRIDRASELAVTP